jgi:hypothetical protein
MDLRFIQVLVTDLAIVLVFGFAAAVQAAAELARTRAEAAARLQARIRAEVEAVRAAENTRVLRANRQRIREEWAAQRRAQQRQGGE